MVVKVNKNWAVNIRNIKDIGVDGDMVVITWLDDTTNKYQADNEAMAVFYFNRLVELTEDAIRNGGLK